MEPEPRSINKFWTTLEQTLSDHQMLDKEDHVLIAVSGGPDSTALCLCLSQIAEKKRLKLGLAHVNHQLRGQDADDDEAFAKKLARQHELPFYSKKANIKAFAADQGLSVEEAGRLVRYNFFEQVAQAQGFNKIATGHTKDDNAEQVLINLLRGSGTKGLSGIPPIRNRRYIRPLIRHLKKEILSYLIRENQSFCTDKTNMDKTFLRNKIRCELIPLLQKEYNPRVIESLDRLTQIAAQEDGYLDLMAEKAFQECRIKTKDQSIELDISGLMDLHPALLARVIRKSILNVKTDLRRISLQHLTDIAGLCNTDKSKKILDLPGRIRIYKAGNLLAIKKEASALRELGAKKKQERLKKARQASAKAAQYFTKP